MQKISFLFIFLLFLVPLSFAHGEQSNRLEDLTHNLEGYSVTIIAISSFIIVLCVFISIYFKKKTELLNMILFLGIVLPALFATAFIAGVTVFTNMVSESQGPVHWHADFEIWKCDEKVDLLNPKGLLNRIGSPSFHEHNDDRIHLEGTVVDLKSVDLHSFFQVIGGNLNSDYAAIPTNNGLIEMATDMKCNGNSAKLQVFVYSITNPSASKKSGFTYTQKKIEDFEDFIMAPYSNVPPGDCIIIELDGEKSSTDRICSSYKLAETQGRITRI
mgnify:CR=1 FL=1